MKYLKEIKTNKTSRSTWACELKYLSGLQMRGTDSHAPRERVSWNWKSSDKIKKRSWSRSTWACELKWTYRWRWGGIRRHAPRERVSWNISPKKIVQLSNASRSTWACELKFLVCFFQCLVKTSRSTWACELKCRYSRQLSLRFLRHAPRERVSWNDAQLLQKKAIFGHAPRERVSWN